MHGTVHDLVPWMKRAGLAATALSAVITSSFGWSLGETILVSLALAGLLSLATFIVGYSLVAAHHAWSNGQHVVAGAAVALCVVGVSVEFLSHVGYTAANRDATVQNASLQQTRYADNRSAVRDLEREVARLEDLMKMTPQRSAAAARSVIDNAQSHKWWARTESCTSTKGPDTRRWCDAYRAAEADLKTWDMVGETETKLVNAREQLAGARKVASSTNGGHAAGASQGMILASLATFNAKPDEQQQFWSGIGISALLAVFAIVAGALLNFVAFALDGARAIAKAVNTAAVATLSPAPSPVPAGDTYHVQLKDDAIMQAIMARVRGQNQLQAA